MSKWEGLERKNEAKYEEAAEQADDGVVAGGLAMLVQCYSKLGRVADARTAYDRLVRLDPDSKLLPPALVRSGRIELWLEMKLPEDQARAQILLQQLEGLPPELRQVDLTPLVTVTGGFTGADLKRTIEDGKAIYAYDKSQGAELRLHPAAVELPHLPLHTNTLAMAVRKGITGVQPRAETGERYSRMWNAHTWDTTSDRR
jgi:tetratricopeptide (TPR) repeat protein